MSVSLKGCRFDHTELSIHSNCSMCYRERSPGHKSVESGIRTNVFSKSLSIYQWVEVSC